ncbi:MAG: hypothetical protein EA422_07625 [Gemmatimonadales bacterium]|nr:MAG: hypothetical protein EA422_07625 [Gemmatimonadales bacterium]
MNWMDELRRLIRRARESEPAPGPEPGTAQGEPGGLTCQEAAARVYEWLDGELDADMHDRVGEHLTTCAHCYPFLQFEDAFRRALQRVGAHPVRAPSDLGDRVRQSLRKEGFGKGAEE